MVLFQRFGEFSLLPHRRILVVAAPDLW